MIKSRKITWADHVAWMGDNTGAYRGLVGRPKRNRLLERPKHRWEDNIKRDLPRRMGRHVLD
jgi:hypothetical protein